jgi:hypothetical protein
MFALSAEIPSARATGTPPSRETDFSTIYEVDIPVISDDRTHYGNWTGMGTHPWVNNYTGISYVKNSPGVTSNNNYEGWFHFNTALLPVEDWGQVKNVTLFTTISSLNYARNTSTTEFRFYVYPNGSYLHATFVDQTLLPSYWFDWTIGDVKPYIDSRDLFDQMAISVQAVSTDPVNAERSIKYTVLKIYYYGSASAEYRNLGTHGLDNLFSSLKVSGTVVLYDNYDLNPTANNKSFTDESVPDLGAWHRGSYGNWDNAAKSLKVNGNVTLYEHQNYANSGRTATFTTNDLPYDDIGTEWNTNPLLKTGLSGTARGWDCNTWSWAVLPTGINALEIYHNDTNNHVDWFNDGLVKSCATDGAEIPNRWKASNFDQGYERYEDEVYDLNEWNNRASSVSVEGSVTVYENIGYSGANTTLTRDVPDLHIYIAGDWNDRICSLKLSRGSRVTFYEDPDYNAPPPPYNSKTWVSPTYRPPDLTVGDKQTITLEGVVEDWRRDTWEGDLISWTGAKFDVFAVEDPLDPRSNTLMLEFYFLRMGGNSRAAWFYYYGTADYAFRHDTPNNYNYLVAIDRFPEHVDRTIYKGDAAKWNIDVKSFIQDACDHYPALDIDRLKIVKMSFTLESAWNGLYKNPMIECSLNRLRLAYTKASETPNEMWLNPPFVDVTGKERGYRFNVTAWANLAVPSFTWQVSMLFNPTFLQITRAGYTGRSKSLFFSGYSTIPVTPIIDNSRGIFTFGESLVDYSRDAGNGSLCWIELELLIPASSTILSIDNGDTFVLNGDLNEIVCMKYDTSMRASGWKLFVGSAHGLPSPGIGDSYYDNDAGVTCSVVSPVTEGSAVWACTGWSGSGSVPSGGDGTSVTFNITQDSSITWNWAQVLSSVHLESIENNGATSNLGMITLDSTSHPAPAIWIEPAAVDVAGKGIRDKFNVTAWINTYQDPNNSAVFTWQITLNFDATMLSVSRVGYTRGATSEFFAGHSTIPVTPIMTSSSASIGESLIGTYLRAPGNGSLCWIELELVSPPSNSTILSIDNTDTFCLNGDLNLVACTKYDVFVGTNLTSMHILPSAPEILLGTYSVLYSPASGYLFDHWEATGNFSVSDINANPAISTLNGLEGTLRATYVYWSKSDINYDLVVDMKDIGIVGRAFYTAPGDPCWNPQADITGPARFPDGKVDMMDIGLVARHFQEHY